MVEGTWIRRESKKIKFTKSYKGEEIAEGHEGSYTEGK